MNGYLPAGYDADKTAKYAVIYLLDGSADEDFIHVIGLVQFNNFEWIDRVPKSIVVGIATIDRQRDFTFPTTGHSAKFITFLEKELQPLRIKQFSTLSGFYIRQNSPRKTKFAKIIPL